MASGWDIRQTGSLPPGGGEPHSSCRSPRAVKAICAPSGDQLPGQPEIDVPIGETPLPSTFIIASPFPLENAILGPSGDQTGDQSAAGLFVSLTRPVPSRLMTQRALFARSISQVNAIHGPSGDHVG